MIPGLTTAGALPQHPPRRRKAKKNKTGSVPKNSIEKWLSLLRQEEELRTEIEIERNNNWEEEEEALRKEYEREDEALLNISTTNKKGEEFPIALSAVAWNCGGIGKREKWKQLISHVNINRCDLIFLSEIKVKERSFKEVEEWFGEQFDWIVEGGEGNSKGVAIGVRNRRVFVEVDSKEVLIPHQAVKVKVRIDTKTFSLISIYRHNRTSLSSFCDHVMGASRGTELAIIAGDWNVGPGRPGWEDMRAKWASHNLVRGEWNAPTHSRGGCIDHFLISNLIANHNPVKVVASPTLKRDHFILSAMVGHKVVAKGQSDPRLLL